jgi:hypothetical protein
MIVATVLAFLTLSASATECTQGLKPDSPITPVGAFSNMRYTEEHAYGYIVELWRAEDCVFGLFFSSAGLMGDTPTGRLEDIAYDKGTRSLSFKARVTMGIIPASTAVGSNSWVPSRDVYNFSGVLEKDSLRGALSHEILNYPGKRVFSSEEVSLPLSSDETRGMAEYRTFSAWQAYADMVLDFRGPKW